MINDIKYMIKTLFFITRDGALLQAFDTNAKWVEWTSLTNHD